MAIADLISKLGYARVSDVARQLGIADRISYLGNQENIESLLPCADLVFQPSEHESFGLVPLEAMASGVPVLATASGGIVEVVEHGVTGLQRGQRREQHGGEEGGFHGHRVVH
jgi:glycosyltransferase involved in cell wall biosynthesis